MKFQKMFVAINLNKMSPFNNYKVTNHEACWEKFIKIK